MTDIVKALGQRNIEKEYFNEWRQLVVKVSRDVTAKKKNMIAQRDNGTREVNVR